MGQMRNHAEQQAAELKAAAVEAEAKRQAEVEEVARQAALAKIHAEQEAEQQAAKDAFARFETEEAKRHAALIALDIVVEALDINELEKNFGLTGTRMRGDQDAPEDFPEGEVWLRCGDIIVKVAVFPEDQIRVVWVRADGTQIFYQDTNLESAPEVLRDGLIEIEEAQIITVQQQPQIQPPKPQQDRGGFHP